MLRISPYFPSLRFSPYLQLVTIDLALSLPHILSIFEEKIKSNELLRCVNSLKYGLDCCTVVLIRGENSQTLECSQFAHFGRDCARDIGFAVHIPGREKNIPRKMKRLSDKIESRLVGRREWKENERITGIDKIEYSWSSRAR